MTVQKNVKSFLEVAISHYSKLSVETFAFFFASERKYFSKKKKYSNWVLIFPLFSQPKHTKYEERTRKSSSRTKKSCLLYDIVLVSNSINTKLLFRHGPSVGDALREWPGRDRGCRTAWTPTQSSPWLPALQLGDWTGRKGEIREKRDKLEQKKNITFQTE